MGKKITEPNPLKQKLWTQPGLVTIFINQRRICANNEQSIIKHSKFKLKYTNLVYEKTPVRLLVLIVVNSQYFPLPSRKKE